MPLQKPRFRISEYRTERGRKLKAKEQRIQKVSISLTSMVDMFAILVIFLLVNSGKVSEWMKLSQTLKVPQVVNGEDPTKAKTITIFSDKWYLEKKLISEAELKAWLKNNSTQMITLVADESLDYEKVYQVLEWAGDAGIKELQLAAETKPL